MALGCLSATATQWQMKQGPAMTRWSETIDPANVLPEYPRPQLEREAWVNLNGVWDLRKGTPGEAYDKAFAYDKAILVPFPLESAISGIMEKSDEQCYWYHRKFTLPAGHDGKRWLLHFGAVDWRCEVWVNGKSVGQHEGGYDPFTFDVTDALVAGAEQDIAVYIYDNTGVEGQPTGKQSKNPSICWYTAVSGIWQTVWLEPVSRDAYIQSLIMEPTLDRSWLNIKLAASDDAATFNVTVKDRDGNVAGTIEGAKPGVVTRVTLTDVHAWSPEDPYLYDVFVTLEKGGVVTDEVKSYAGMRRIEVKKDNAGIPRIYLNGKQIFQLGPLDQGWWPDGLYTAPSDEALLFDIKGMKDLGCNMIRKHIKVEPDRWYYHCDREGILVWQDLPSGNLVKDGEQQAKEIMEREWLNIVDALKSHPSIVHWIVFNEGWGQFDTDRMTNLIDSRVNNLSPARYGKASLICCASGWTDSEVGNIIDTHSYPHPGCPHNANRAAVCGEYGGITLKVPGHIWPGGDFQYTVVESSEDFTTYFNGLGEEIKDLYAMGLNAAVYTQLSDVEIEKNGFYTYDRRVLKPASPYGRLRQNILECINLPSTPRVETTILSTAMTHAHKWRYITSAAPRHWYDATFDDSSWSVGEAAFGHGMNEYKELVRTDWNTNQIYMRRWFYLSDISPENIAKLRFKLFHDDDVDLYINGVWAGAHAGCTFSYWYMDINHEALATLKPNSWNLIALAGKQGTGQQFMDVGLVAIDSTTIEYNENFDDLQNPERKLSPSPGTAVLPKFERVMTPVPAEPAQRGGDGTSVPAGEFFHAQDRNNVAWADVDGDGALDVVYSAWNSHLQGDAGRVSLYYKNDGKGSFSRTANSFSPTYYACPVFLDYDNDGNLDLFYPGLTDRNIDSLDKIVAHLYHNNGDGTFTEVNDNAAMGIAPIYNATDGGRSRQWVDTGDYDRDGYTDIVVTGREDYMGKDGYGRDVLMSDRRVTYLYRNVAGTCFEKVELPVNGKSAFHALARGSVYMRDMDNDGLLDVVSAGYEANNGAMYIYWNNGDGTFSESSQRFCGAYDGACVPADLDGDGLDDILVTGFSANKGNTAKSVFVYRNNGNRTFAMLNDEFSGFEGVDGSTPSIADVNHDGLADILIGGHGQTHEITTWLYINKGDMAFEPAGAYYLDPFGKQWSFARVSHGNNHLVDIDNDGFLDAWNMGWAQNNVCASSCATLLYRNTSASLGIAPNEAPSVPTGLKAVCDNKKGTATFSWDASTDDVTPQPALRYNFYLRKKGSDKVFMAVPANIENGRLKVGETAGAIAITAHTMTMAIDDADYEWGVQAIDNGKRASAWTRGVFNPTKSGLPKKEIGAVRIYGHNGVLNYDIAGDVGPARLLVYSTDAALMASINASGQGSINLGHGTFIVTARPLHAAPSTTKVVL